MRSERKQGTGPESGNTKLEHIHGREVNGCLQHRFVPGIRLSGHQLEQLIRRDEAASSWVASPNFHVPSSAWLYMPWDLAGRQFLLVSSNQVQLCLFFTLYLWLVIHASQLSCVTSLSSSARPSFSHYPTSPSNVPDFSSSCPSTPGMASPAPSPCFSASFPTIPRAGSCCLSQHPGKPVLARLGRLSQLLHLSLSI